jgi:hypothetical protein
MVDEREIFGGKELMDFFCKDAVEGNIDNKEFCRFIVDYENKDIYTESYTSYEDGDALYNDLINPNVKWDVTFDYSFEDDCEVLQFENGNNYVEFDNVDYNEVKDFFEANKIKKIEEYELFKS